MLNEKIAIVTGAGRGIGRGIAERLAAEGATVVVTDIDAAAAGQTARAISGSAIAMTTDVTSAASVTAMASWTQSRFGRIDVLVNNAGWDKAGPFTDSGQADTALFASLGGDDPRLRDALIRAIPLRRLARPADVAAAVAFFASGDATFITGQTISVSGGLTMS
jgi:NAD(P)-dependent dehydrogenase (short-subunit alcohol dehydrogenase family)